MSVAPANPASVLVTVSGVLQDPSTYSVSGNTLTFSQSPPLGSANISTRYLGIPASGVTTTAYRTITDFTATAGQTVFTPPSYTVGFLNVYQNGVRLGMADYVATNGTTVTLLVAASLNDLITTESFFVSSVLNALPQTGGSILGSLGVSGLATFSGGLVAPGGISNTAIGATTLSVSGNTLLAQSYDQGTGVLQVTGQSTFNGAVVDKSLNLQGGNNLLTYSQLFSSWASTGLTFTGSQSDPFGGTNAQLVNGGTSTGLHCVILNYTSIASVYTLSVYVKAGTCNFVALFNNGANSGVIFNATTGAYNALMPGAVAPISYNSISVGNGWFRYSITFTATAASNQFDILMSENGTSISYTGTSQNIYWFGAQLELGTVASAYTPTTTAAITTTNNISVPSGQVITQVGTISAPSYALGVSNTGWYMPNANTIAFSYIGYDTFRSDGSGNGAFKLASVCAFGFSSGNPSTALDTIITRDAANTLAQRNSTNAQTFRLYNTYTDASNYERLSIDWSTTANTATISTQNAGTGSARNLAIGQDLFINGARAGKGVGSLATNTAFGVNALSSASLTGQNSVAFGNNALLSQTSGSYNTAVGSSAMVLNTTGTRNTAVGEESMYFNISGAYNIAVGAYSLYSNTTGQQNVALGDLALSSNTVGSYGTAVGKNALFNNTTVSSLTAIGYQSLTNNTTNVATLGTITGGTGYTNGTYTGVVMTLSSGSTAITYPTATIVVAGGVVTTVTLTSNGVGFKDTTTVLTAPAASIGGTGSGFSVPVATLASGTGNVAVGYQAGYTNSVGTQNTFTGYQAGYSNLTGLANTFNGYQAGYASTATGNSAFGNTALKSLTSGGNSTAVGSGALTSVTTSSNNTAVGTIALYLSTGANNTALGYSAGYGTASPNANTTGINNTYIGVQTVGSANNNTNEMVIGYQAVGLGSNTTVIGNSSTTATYLYGSIVQNAPIATSAAAPTIASSATIAPTAAITFISGTTTINTITAPSPLSAAGGQITLIPTGLWSTGTSGNIALATTAVVGKALILFYDATTTKWYPSY